MKRSRLPLVFVIVAPSRWEMFRGTRRFMMLNLALLGTAGTGEVGLLMAPAGER